MGDVRDARRTECEAQRIEPEQQQRDRQHPPQDWFEIVLRHRIVAVSSRHVAIIADKIAMATGGERLMIE
jgi:hypothetical protein